MLLFVIFKIRKELNGFTSTEALMKRRSVVLKLLN